MHMICPSMPIPASTELTEFLYILCHKKLLNPNLAPLYAGARGIYPSAPPTTAFSENIEGITLTWVCKSTFAAWQTCAIQMSP